MHNLCETAYNSAPAPMALATRVGAEIWLHQTNDAFRRLFRLQRGVRCLSLHQVFRRAAARLETEIGRCLDEGAPTRLSIAHEADPDVLLLEICAQRLTAGDSPQALISASTARSLLSHAPLSEADAMTEIGALTRGLVYIHDFEQGMIRCGDHPILNRTGVSPGSMPAPDALRVIDTADRPAISRFLQRQLAAADGEIVQCVCRVRAVDGEALWINVRAEVFARDPSGRVLRTLNVATDETEQHRHKVELAEIERALVEAELQERRRIGRELHDSTAQLLLAARLGLTALSAQNGLSPESLRILEDARDAIDGAQREIRNVSYTLHPPSLMDVGLEGALRNFASGFARRTGLEIAVEAGRGRWRLPFTSKVALFRVAQESLMNVHRHARATRATVRLTQAGDQVMLEVEDDGTGLPEGFNSEMEGVGISGMRERLNQNGGRFEIQRGRSGVLVRAIVRSEPPPRPARRRAPAQPVG